MLRRGGNFQEKLPSRHTSQRGSYAKWGHPKGATCQRGSVVKGGRASAIVIFGYSAIFNYDHIWQFFFICVLHPARIFAAGSSYLQNPLTYNTNKVSICVSSHAGHFHHPYGPPTHTTSKPENPKQKPMHHLKSCTHLAYMPNLHILEI